MVVTGTCHKWLPLIKNFAGFHELFEIIKLECISSTGADSLLARETDTSSSEIFYPINDECFFLSEKRDKDHVLTGCCLFFLLDFFFNVQIADVLKTLLLLASDV